MKTKQFRNPIPISLATLLLAVLACSPMTNENTPGVIADSSEGEAIDLDSSQLANMQTAFGELPMGDAARGEQIFVTQPCHVCHNDVPLGPPFPGQPPLVTLAATRRPGYPADVYLYESIVDPSAYVTQGFEAGIMPGEFNKTLTAQDLADLVAYLMTMQ